MFTPFFLKIEETYSRTVKSLMPSAKAIFLFVSPSRSNCRTSCSRFVRSSLFFFNWLFPWLRLNAEFLGNNVIGMSDDLLVHECLDESQERSDKKSYSYRFLCGARKELPLWGNKYYRK